MARVGNFLERLYGANWEAMVLSESAEVRFFERLTVFDGYLCSLPYNGAEGRVCSDHEQLASNSVPGAVELPVLGVINSCRLGCPPPVCSVFYALTNTMHGKKSMKKGLQVQKTPFGKQNLKKLLSCVNG